MSLKQKTKMLDGEDVFLFDLTMTENFDSMKGKRKKTLKEATQVEGAEKQDVNGTGNRDIETVKAQLRSDFSEKITSTYGETIEEDQARRQQNLSSFLEVQSE